MQTAPITDGDASWKKRFRIPVIRGVLARRNHQRGLVISNRSGIFQLYAWDIPNGKLRQLTDYPTGKLEGEISNDGRYIYYLKDEQGDEIGHFVRIDFETGERVDLTPEVERYSPVGHIASNWMDTTIACLVADQDEGLQLFVQPTNVVRLEEPNCVYRTKNSLSNPVFSYGGDLIVLQTNENSKSQLIVIDVAKSREIIAKFEDGDDANLEPIQFASLPDDARLLLSTDRSGFNRPLIWNVRTDERIKFKLDELGDEGDVSPQDWSTDGKFVLLLYTINAHCQLYLYSMADEKLNKLEKQPEGTLQNARFGDGTIFVEWESVDKPSRIVVLDVNTGALKSVALGTADKEIPPSSPWRSVTFPSSDGQIIQGWLAVPKDRERGPYPTILHVHGGPDDVATETFDASAQAWLDHGIAYLSINYRGSTTFGRDFQHKIYSNVGHWEMEDILAARQWLLDQGIAQPKAILLEGWSYGGFLTLITMSKKPDLWAGGVAGIAIADWIMLEEDAAESMKAADIALFGATPEENPEVYKAASPMTYIEQMAAPVFIIQAKNDGRCPPRQMKVYEAKMRELGKDIQIEWFDGGHIPINAEQSISHQGKLLDWAYRVFGKGEQEQSSENSQN